MPKSPLLAIAIAATLTVPASARSFPRADVVPASCTTTDPSDDYRTPVLRGPLYEGDTLVRIQNQSDGATLALHKLGSAPLFSGVSTKDSQIFSIGSSLSAGDEVRVCQSSTVSVCSEWMTVRSAPSALPTPGLVHAKIKQGDEAVAVGGIVPGATVKLTIGGVLQTQRWAGPTQAVSLPLDPTMAVGTTVSITQEIDGVVSSALAVTNVSATRTLTTPRIIEPVEPGDQGVWVSNVSPGSTVEITDGAGTVLGTKVMGESFGFVQTCGIGSTVQAKAKRGGSTVTASSISSMSIPTDTYITEVFDFGTSSIGKGMTGKIWLPSTSTFDNPIVFMLHGTEQAGSVYCDLPGGNDPTSIPQYADSYLGYEYLAKELAKQGIWAVSIEVEGTPPSVSDRYEHAAEVIDELLNWGYSAVDEDSPIALMGHSNGGDAMMLYASTNPLGLDLRGTLALAPSSSVDGADEPEDGLPLLIIQGNEDYFFDWSSPTLNSVVRYDNAWKSKSYLSFDGAGHDCFNSCWCSGGSNPGTLSEQDHQTIVTELGTRFFHGLLFDEPDYAQYIRTWSRPKALYPYSLTPQTHTKPGLTIVDNFGDLEGETTIVDQNLDSEENALGGSTTEANAASTMSETTHAGLEGDGDYDDAWHLEDGRVLTVEWDSRSWIWETDIPLAERPSLSSTDLLSFRALAIHGESENSFGGRDDLSQELRVTVIDAQGRRASVRAGAFGTVAMPAEREDGTYVHLMSTIRIPMDAFKAVKPSLNLNRIATIKFDSTLRDEGRIVIDDLEFATK